MGFEEGQVIFKCPKCCSIKPDRAHHCSVCQRWTDFLCLRLEINLFVVEWRCIKKMDHHCPWVNNCVGERNQKFFVLFTFYIGLISYHSLFIGINHFITCIQADWKTCTAYSPPATVVFILFLLFEVKLLVSIWFSVKILFRDCCSDCSHQLCLELRSRPSGTTRLE